MENESKELIKLLGDVAETAGRMLQRKRELTLDDLTHLQGTFEHASETLKIVKDIEVLHHS